MFHSYTKIDTVLQRDLEGTKRLIPGTFRDPAVEYLKDLKWEVQEKCDGTNVQIWFDGNRVQIMGRDEKSLIPDELMEVLKTKFLNDETEQLFEQMFPPKLDEEGNEKLVEVSIFGEGIGPKIQKVGPLYGSEYRFLVFDVRVSGVYLEHSSDIYKQVVNAFDLETVPDLPDMTVEEAEAYVKTKPKSLVNPKAPMEGVVIRPKVRLYNQKGERIIVKVKCRDYEPYNAYAEKYAWIKRGKAVVYMSETSEIGSRCVTYEPIRCTVADILGPVVWSEAEFKEGGRIDKVVERGDRVVLKEINGTRQITTPKLELLSRYDKAKWEQMKKEENDEKDA